MDWRYPTVRCECCGNPVHCGNVIYAPMPPPPGSPPGEGDRPLWVCPACFLGKGQAQRVGTAGHSAA